MKLHRFYIEETVGNADQIRIASSGIGEQLQRVVKRKPGDNIIIFDNSGFEYEVVIIGYDNYTIICDVKKKTVNNILPKREVYLFASIVKKDKFEWIVEKGTELGVTHIIPVISARSEKKDLNTDRLKRISVEACEQSGRATIPEIADILNLDDAITLSKSKTPVVIAFHTDGEIFKKEEFSKEAVISAFIGPEGGWTPEEIEMFHKSGMAVRNLGPQVLRAETAVVAALAQLVF